MNMRRALWTAGLVMALLAPLLSACSLFGIRTYEEAEYDVVRADGEFELRSYGELVLVRTAADADYDEAGSIAFRRLFRYISGENERQEEIAMTAPVFQEERGQEIAMTAPVLQERQGDGWSLAFVLPADYTLESAPRPTDPGLRLERVEGKEVAALRYSGSRTEESIRENSERLLAWIEENGYEARSAPRSAAYDPPWTIPFLRRNEVLVDVE